MKDKIEGVCHMCLKDKLGEYVLYMYKVQTEGLCLIHV